MRLTCILYRQNFYQTIIRMWKKQGKMQINELAIPPELEEMGAKIYDAKQLFCKPKKPQVKKSEIPTPAMKPEIPTIERYSTKQKYYLFTQKTRVSEGLNQVLALTKTISYEGLPPKLNSLVGLEQTFNQHDLVKDCINQSLVFDAWQKKLPKKLDITNPGWIFPRDYGTPLSRKTSLLLNKLVLLCESACGRHVETLNRTKIPHSSSELLINSGGESITFKLHCDILITDENRLKPFGSAEEVEETKLKELASVYPIKATLDLDQCETCPFDGSAEEPRNDLPRGYIHTLYVPHKSIGFFFPVQKQARGIACCFSHAAEEAQRLYGPDVKDLLEPVSVQCIYMDVKSFGFLAYQLNTLDLANGEGIKNQVWFDGPYDLYEEISEETGVINYNPEIFTKMLAFYMNGIHPASLQ